MKPRFNLKWLLLILTLASIPFAIWGRFVEPYRQQAAAMARLNSLEAWNGSNDRNTVSKIDFAQPDGAAWRHQLVETVVGAGSCIEVTLLRLPAETSEADAAYILSRMPFLKLVGLERTKLSDRTLRCVAAMPELAVLELPYCDLSDDEMAVLSSSRSIERLTLTGNALTDAALPALAQLEKLQGLYLRWTNVTAPGVEAFQLKRPNCEVYTF